MKILVLFGLLSVGVYYTNGIDSDKLEKQLHERMGISQDDATDTEELIQVNKVAETKKLIEKIEEAKAKAEPSAPDVRTNEDSKLPIEPSETNPHIEDKDVVQGDEMVTLDQIKKDLNRELVNQRRRKRQFQTDKSKVWPLNIDYYIDQSLERDIEPKVHEGMKWITENTCLTMRHVRSKSQARKPFMSFTGGTWCQSFVGMITNLEQAVQMVPGCARVGTIIHETFHALGFYHEQSRSDRDNHVRINLHNVQSGAKRNFEKQESHNFNNPYIYGSLMAYTGGAFSTGNGKQTIVANDQKYQRAMGYRFSGTFADAKRVNNAYKCMGRCSNGARCRNGGYPNPKRCSNCLCPESFTGHDCGQIKRSVDPTGSNRGCGGVIQLSGSETRHVLSAKSQGQDRGHYCITQFKSKGGRDYGLPGYRDCCADQIDRQPIKTDSNMVIATAFARQWDSQLTVYAKAVTGSGGGGGGWTNGGGGGGNGGTGGGGNGGGNGGGGSSGGGCPFTTYQGYLKVYNDCRRKPYSQMISCMNQSSTDFNRCVKHSRG